MTSKQSSFLLFISLVAIIGFFALSIPAEWSVLDKATIPEQMTSERVVNILGNERVAYKVGDDGSLNVRQSERSKTELLLRGLSAIQNLQEEHSSEDVIGELIVQHYLKRKVDDLMDGLVGKGAYISEIYVSPTHSSLSINNSIKPHDLVTYFLNSPGVKRIYFRLIVDSDVLSKKELDPDFIESRVKRYIRTLLHDLKGVRLTEEITFVPFHGTGLSSIATNESPESRIEQWVSQLLVPLLAGAAIVITFLLVLLFKKQKQQVMKIKEEAICKFNQDFESINFEEDQEGPEQYIQLNSQPTGVMESFTDSIDIGNILLFLHPKEAAKFLQMLPFDQQVKSIGECIGYHHLDMVERERVIEKVSRQLEFDGIHENVLHRSSIKHVAKILNELQPVNSKRILQELHQIDSTSLVRLKNEFFVLTALIPLGGEGVRYILNKGSGLDLLLAVHHSDSLIKEKIIHLAPKEIRAKLSEDFSKVDPFKIQAAQLRVTKLIVEFERLQVESKQGYTDRDSKSQILKHDRYINR